MQTTSHKEAENQHTPQWAQSKTEMDLQAFSPSSGLAEDSPLYRNLAACSMDRTARPAKGSLSSLILLRCICTSSSCTSCTCPPVVQEVAAP